VPLDAIRYGGGLCAMIDSNIQLRLEGLRRDISEEANALGLSHSAWGLIAVSKTKSIEAVAEAWKAGQRDFGENYVQEGVEKIQQAQAMGIDACWHFIGPLQSNKTRDVAEHFDWVHSLDRFKIALRLSDQRPPALPPLRTCIQVNISGEASKSGVSLEALPDLCAQVQDLSRREGRIELCGLMAIPEAIGETSAQLSPAEQLQRQTQVFVQLAQALEALSARHAFQTPCLSMGMSDDWRAALRATPPGVQTWLRIGTAIFGSRS